ncbi:MAG: class I tRNA ligase family protein, partial [Candidatus Aenigmatarchaeota archaeon]
VALCVHPDETYVRAEVCGQILILAEERLDLFEKLEAGYRVLEKFRGSSLEGMSYEPILDIPLQEKIERRVIVSIPLMKKKVSGKVAAKKETGAEEETQFGHLVDISTGTGIVHIAPGHGEEDHRIGKHYNLESPSPVDPAGRLMEGAGIFAGMTTDDANKAILDYLKEKGALLHSEKIVHSYPLCWRCKTPLIYRKTKQWFLKLDTLREKILHENKKVSWLPAFAGEQYQNVVKSAPDWAITRQRYWGIPLPLWTCRNCSSIKVIGSIKELKEHAIGSVPEDLQLSVDYVDDIKLKCPCGGEMEREREVMDVWFDSGIAPWASLGYPYKNKGLFERLWPVDLIDESIDQIRGWFNSLMVCSVAAFDEKPYETVCLNGWTLDEKGEKMSKSLGNGIWGKDAYETLGSDILRLYVCYANAPWDVQRFSFEEAKKLQTELNILWNLATYLETYGKGKAAAGTGKISPKNLSDIWIVSKANTLVEEVTGDLENFRFHFAARKALRFLVDDFSRIYVKLVRDRIESDPEVSKVALYVLERVLKFLAPFTPFFSEDIYRRFFEGSVHLSEWPKCDDALVNRQLEKDFESAKEITEAINAERQKNGVGLRLPVLKATVFGGPEQKNAVEGAKEIILTLSNLKEVVFRKSGNVEIKPNFAALGKKFGSRTQDVAKAIALLKPSQVSDRMKIGGFEIEKDDLIIRQKTAEGTVFGGGYVVLDLAEDEDLKTERFMRELIRKIQQARKEAKLQVTDRIELFVEDRPFFKGREKELMGEVGAKAVCYGVKSKIGEAEYKDLKSKFGFAKN